MNPISSELARSGQSDARAICYLINLDRSQDRLARVGSRLDHLGIGFERISAVDGNKLPAGELARLTQRNFFYRPLYPGEVGCYMSHVAAMRLFLASSSQYALVLEDDVVLPDNLDEIVAAAIHLREASTVGPAAWNVLKLQGQRKWHIPIAKILPGYELVEYGFSVPACTGAAIWNRDGAQRFLDHFKGVARPVDCELQHPWELGLQIRSIYPSIVRAEGASTIGKRKQGRSNPFLKSRYEARRIIPKARYFLKTYGFFTVLRRMLGLGS
ncbi:MAG: glycosyltransferase family 25 protein [Rhizobium sp.]|nr:MAG: glycosyltransferase family 25 protein [Rhizobium sp.]